MEIPPTVAVSALVSLTGVDWEKANLGSRMRRRAADESGQILTMTAVSIVLMLVCVGLVVDVGHAMLVQRQLQAGVDAAALAGAQHLPDAPAAESVAVQYSASPGSKNSVNTVDNAATIAKAACLQGVPGCNRRDGGVNGIVVESKSDVPTWFGRIIGIDKLKVSAKATACSPCSVKPLDIMIVLDRTGSMCQFAPGVNDPNCTDLKNARQGIETFLGFMDPSVDKVGLALTPPVLEAQYVADCPYTPWDGDPPGPKPNGKYYGYDQWWHPDGIDSPTGSNSSFYVVASLEGADGIPGDDYLVQDMNGDWILNKPPNGPGTSAVIQRLNCTGGAGSTSYALSIEEAKRELNAHGRGNVQDIVIFLSDGAANTSPQTVPNGHWTSNGTGPGGWIWKPCGSGVESAKRIKPTTIVYTIGYDLDAGAGAPEKCRRPNLNGHQNGGNPVETGCGTVPTGWGGVTTGCSAYDAIRAMASVDSAGQPLFYNKPNPGQLNDIFRAIALDLSGSRGRLIDNTSPNLIG